MGKKRKEKKKIKGEVSNVKKKWVVRVPFDPENTCEDRSAS